MKTMTKLVLSQGEFKKAIASYYGFLNTPLDAIEIIVDADLKDEWYNATNLSIEEQKCVSLIAKELDNNDYNRKTTIYTADEISDKIDWCLQHAQESLAIRFYQQYKDHQLSSAQINIRYWIVGKTKI